MISLRSIGVLVVIEAMGFVQSAEELARLFPEGRDAIQASLRELREAGFIETKRTRIGSRYVTQTYSLKPAFQALESRLLSPQSQQNSNKVLIPIHTETITNSRAKPVMEGNSVGYEFFGKQSSMDDEERYHEAHKHRLKQREIYQSEKAKYVSEKRVDRHKRPKAEWSCLDVAYEFADRSQDYWNIPPWSVNKSRFVQALGNVRKHQKTDGEIECQAIESFFKSISVDKYNDGEHLWKMFISRFPALIGELRDIVREDEEISEESLLRTAKALKMLED